MSAFSGMRRRVLLGVVVVAVLGAVLQTATLGRSATHALAIHFQQVYDPVPADALEACVADPAGWRAVGPGWDAYAYDPVTYRSANPAAPPMPSRLAYWLWLDGERAAQVFFSGPWGGAVGWETGAAPPCGLVVLRWQLDPARRRVVHLFGAGSLAGILLATTAVGAFLAARPLIRRLDAVTAAARAVGTPAYRPMATGDDDDLDALARVLDEAHQRVLTEHRAEEARRAALERHLADVAHDLRTPLASLHLRLEALAQGQEEALPGALSDVLSLALLTENLHLEAVLRDVPDGDPPVTDLVEVVERVRARFAVLGARQGVTVDGATPDAPVPVRVQPVHAEQAFANLVHNAVTHHHVGGHVAVVLEVRGDAFRVVVVDDGPGVRTDELPRLAERAYRTAAARSRCGRGRGLGLPIVAQVCARAGWTLDLAAPPEGGLRVTVVGPLAG